MLHLSDNIKRIRQLTGLSQGDFGRHFKATKDQVASWESRRAEPNGLYIEAIAAIASIPVDDLMNKKLSDEDITLVIKDFNVEISEAIKNITQKILWLESSVLAIKNILPKLRPNIGNDEIMKLYKQIDEDTEAIAKKRFDEVNKK